MRGVWTRTGLAGVLTLMISVAGCTDEGGDLGPSSPDLAKRMSRAPVAVPGGPYAGTIASAVVLDGSGSYDPDGPNKKLQYAWDLGDGSVASVRSPSHLYSEAGVYTVSLTVTDHKGVSSTPVTTTVAITEASLPGTVLLVQDLFGRSVTGGWGDADVGGTWRVNTGVAANDFSVSGGRGWISKSDASPRNAVASAGYGTDVAGLASFSIETVPDDLSRFYTVQVYARRNDSESDGDFFYRYRIRAYGTGAMDVRLEKSVDGVDSFVSDIVSIPATWAAGQKYWVRWECVGASPATVLRMRVWADGATEPGSWQVEATVDEPDLDLPGTTGFRVSGPSAGQTNFPVIFGFDDLEYVEL